MDGTEEEFYGDSGYLGAEKREEAILTNDQGKEIRYIICARPSILKKRMPTQNTKRLLQQSTPKPRYAVRLNTSSPLSKGCSVSEKHDYEA